jgi:hypothetical protein
LSHIIDSSNHFTIAQSQILVSTVADVLKTLQSSKFIEYVRVTLSHISTVFVQFEHHDIMIERVIRDIRIIFLNIEKLLSN